MTSEEATPLGGEDRPRAPFVPAVGAHQAVRTYREGTSGLTVMVAEADAAAMAQVGYVPTTRHVGGARA